MAVNWTLAIILRDDRPEEPNDDNKVLNLIRELGGVGIFHGLLDPEELALVLSIYFETKIIF